MTVKLRLFFIISVFLSLSSYSQLKDTLTNTIQFHQINENLSIGFKKPRTLDMFRYIPKDIVALGKFAIQKENLKWDVLAVGTTLAIIPFDQKITEKADELGASIGIWNEDARYKKVCGLLTIVAR